MIQKCLNTLLLPLLFFCNTGCSDYPSPEEQMIDASDGGPNGVAVSYKERAKETYDMIQQLYSVGGNLYKENIPIQDGDRPYSYLWPYVGMLTAGNLLYELGYGEDIHNKEFTGLEAYYDNRTVLPTYQAYPVSGGGTDHYYDDSSIVAMELIDAYKLTGNNFFLERAESVAEFIMSGEDDRLGGGLYWFEAVSTECNSGPNCMKAANTTAYASFVASELYMITSETEYLEFAERTYQWNYDTLRDPADNIYYNSINIGTLEIDATKWTYNAAMMIMSGVNLYKITEEEVYLNQAIATAQSAFSRFTSVRNDLLFYTANDSWFNVELMSSFIRLAEYFPGADQYVQVFIQDLDYAWENSRTESGQYYEDWAGINQGRYYWLLHQAALIEAYGRASIYLNEQ